MEQQLHKLRESERRNCRALQRKPAKKQEEKREHLQESFDRFRASATKATQAQSRLKTLAKMEPIVAVVDEACCRSNGRRSPGNCARRL